jgi:hypothetical protein
MQALLAYHAYKGRCNAGCVVPELLDGTKHIPWFQAGATIFDKKGIQYLGVPGLINAKSIIATLLVQVTATRSAVVFLRHRPPDMPVTIAFCTGSSCVLCSLACAQQLPCVLLKESSAWHDGWSRTHARHPLHVLSMLPF